MHMLARLLIDYELDLLHVIASQWDIELSRRGKLEAAEELAVGMLTQEQTDAAWERLDDAERQVIAMLAARNGRQLYAHFTRQYGDLRPMGPARREREKPWLSSENITETLYYRGIIYRVFEQSEVGAQQYFIVPDDLLALLPHESEKIVQLPPGYAATPPQQTEESRSTSPDDMATLLAYFFIREENAQDFLSKETIPRIDRHLRRPSATYRAMLIQLADDLDLLNTQTTLTYTVSLVDKETSRPWLEASLNHQVRSLAEAWLNSENWNDLAYVPGLDADEWHNDPRLSRRAILDALKTVPSEVWWDIESFIASIKRETPDFQRTDGNYGSWYIRDKESGTILQGFEYWDHIEGDLIRFLFEGPLHWLGLVESAQGAFRLTDAGLVLMGRGEWSSDPDPENRIQIDQQGVVDILPDISRYDRFQIARFAAWVKAPPPNQDHSAEATYQYRLTPQGFQRVEDEGISLMTHIIPYLQRLSSQSVPHNVIKMLEGWHNEPGLILIEDAVIFTAKNIQIYDQMRRDKQVNKWLGQKIGPRSHAVKRRDLAPLLNTLREIGLLPHFVGHEKDDLP